VPGLARAGRFDIADIVRDHRAALESVCKLSPEQKRVLTDIAQCRTAVLGGHLDVCTTCGYESERPSYNSCRNRHCPKCQALVQEKWIERRRARMLDVQYFHVVFTLPAELRPLAAFAPRAIYEALFRAASQTLLAFGESRLKAKLGATLVLHTWTRDLSFHPHVHAIVTGGGLALDGSRWERAHRRFLFPVKAMSRVLRGKMKDELRHAERAGKLAGFEDFRDPEGFAHLLARIALKSWNIYAKPSFDSGKHVLGYLGRYTHRVGIANSRLIDVTETAITFRTKGDGVATLTPVDFLRRFVRHVLPNGFHKIRHIGLHASPKKLELARQKLGQAPIAPRRISWRASMGELLERDLCRCPQCGGILVTVALPPTPRERAPPQQLGAA
jgi:Putative transposase/Transposase zinc-binding domain